MSETESLPDVPDPSAHHLFRVPRKQLLPFFGQVPRLFAQEQARVHDAYQSCLYATEHDFTPEDLMRIEAAFGLEVAQWGSVDPLATIAALDRMRYPDTTGIARIAAVPGLSLRTVSHYLHFFHHTYPMYDKATLAGLATLGMDVPWSLVRDPEVYGLYIAALDELKDRIPFWCVPETNVHLTRIVQAALVGCGRDST